jgi:hypothetical protein
VKKKNGPNHAGLWAIEKTGWLRQNIWPYIIEETRVAVCKAAVLGLMLELKSPWQVFKKRRLKTSGRMVWLVLVLTLVLWISYRKKPVTLCSSYKNDCCFTSAEQISPNVLSCGPQYPEFYKERNSRKWGTA